MTAAKVVRQTMKDDKRLKRKVRNSYLISTLSMALVLFLLGSVGYLMMAAMRLTETLQRSVVVTVELAHGYTYDARDAVVERLSQEAMVADIRFLSKEEKAADEEFRRLFGADFEEVLGENPLLDSYEVTLTAASADRTAVESLVTALEAMPAVERAGYPAQMAERLHATIAKVRFVLLLFGGTLLIISLILLNNTVRLAIFSKRYVINTMKLVGATKWFIMRPFLWSGLSQGFWSGILAAALFAGAVYGLTEQVPELSSMADLQQLGILIGIMVGVGMLLSLLFTAFAVNKFVNMKSNKIYLY